MLAAGWTSWDETVLGPCLKYIWGSTKANIIPEDWKGFDDAARANFPLGNFRGFNYLWHSNISELSHFEPFLKERKTTTKERKTATKERKKKRCIFIIIFNVWIPAEVGSETLWKFNPISLQRLHGRAGLPAKPWRWLDAIASFPALKKKLELKVLFQTNDQNSWHFKSNMWWQHWLDTVFNSI